MKKFLRPIVSAFLLWLAPVIRAQSYTISTLAGRTSVGNVDGIGVDARFIEPLGIAIDQSGNNYVVDSAAHTLRKVTPAGVVTTVAGLAGIAGSYDGIGGAALFSSPNGVTVDANGMVYVCDTSNDTIRKVTPAGIVTTLAGSPGRAGSVDDVGGSARFAGPASIAADGAGNLYVADVNNHAIRKVTPDGVVTTLAGLAGVAGSVDGTGKAARFNRPAGVAVDTGGNVYVADSANSTIRKVTANGSVTTLAGLAGSTGGNDGVGSVARFFNPFGVAVDGTGTVYVSDSINGTVRIIASNLVVTTLAGGFAGARALTVDGSGNVFVADDGNHAVKKITPNGIVTTLAGSTLAFGSADGVGSGARFRSPNGLTVDSSGNVFVADSNAHAIRKIAPTGIVTTLAGQLGAFGGADGVGNAARFWGPWGIAVDGTGNLFVAEIANDTIRKITPAGVVTTVAGAFGVAGSADGIGSIARFKGPQGVAVDSTGNLFVADTNNSTIRKITPAGVVTTFAGLAGSLASDDGVGSAARFRNPSGLAIDRFDNLYVGDISSHAIRKITPAGVVTTLAGSPPAFGTADGQGSDARFTAPRGVAVDPAGNVFVAESNDHTIRKITPDGMVTTIGGLGGYFGSGDGVGNAARFYSPAGVAVDALGFLYIADSNNNEIRLGFPAPLIIAQPQSQAVPFGGSARFSVAIAAADTFQHYQWRQNGVALDGAVNPTLTIGNFQPANASLYTALISTASASTTSDPAIVGVTTNSEVVGAGAVLQPTHIQHPNGNYYDQILLTGAGETITAIPGQVARTSFVDLTNDIVQVEFSGAGSLSLVLDNPTGPADAVNYNQPTVSYMKGHAGIVITGANETTNVTVFSVGIFTALNQAIFKSGVSYDGVSDLAFIAISSTNGKFGGLRASNAACSAAEGYTGIYAPGVTFTGPVYIGEITASAAATPVFIIGSSPDTRITGGDLLQPNGLPVKVAGLTQLKFTAGSTSHGSGDLPAQANRAVLLQNGADVTARTVVNPTP